jgi:hypothetical protein
MQAAKITTPRRLGTSIGVGSPAMIHRWDMCVIKNAPEATAPSPDGSQG